MVDFENMTDEELKAYRKGVVLDEYFIWDIVDTFNEEQFKKVKAIVSETLTDEQIDALFSDLG